MQHQQGQHILINGMCQQYNYRDSPLSETLNMSSEQLGEMFEGDSADTSAGKFPLMLMGG